jgi:hypothetical protein
MTSPQAQSNTLEQRAKFVMLGSVGVIALFTLLSWLMPPIPWLGGVADHSAPPAKTAPKK